MDASTSPVIPKSESVVGIPLTWGQACEQIAAGKKVTKMEWGDSFIFLQLIENKLRIHLADDKYHELIVTYGDLTGDDYLVIG